MSKHQHELEEPAETEVLCRPGLESDVYELWTASSVYVLDEYLRCIEVKTLGRDPGPETQQILGAELAGSREGGRFRSSLPPPGTRAVFAAPDEAIAVTSNVLRLVKNTPLRE